MRTSHGDAERLSVEDVDPERLDEVLKNGDDPRRSILNDFLGPGRFGKLFPDLDPFRPTDEALRNLGAAMREIAPEDPTLNNSDIPAGVTYLGQFIDHDITLDKTKGFPEIDDPEEIEQGRTPSLDLDSLYGLGPRRQPELYDQSVERHNALFKIGLTSSVPSAGGNQPGTPEIPVSMPHDLPRTNQTAVIGDPRNDENLVVAQVHLAFLKFHNRVMATLPQTDQDNDKDVKYTLEEEESGPKAFHKARRLVRWHYQWLVLNDFLPKLVDSDVLNDVKSNGPSFFQFKDRPFMPVEFSVAAYRLGHSMIRESYNYNRVFADRSVEPNALTSATLGLLFRFTGGGGNAPIPSNWICDFRRFFNLDGPQLLNFTRALDTKLVPQLHELPGITSPEPNSLAVRNLLRGSRIGLPKAQDVADAMGITALTPDEIANGDDAPILRQHNFHEETPLWYYVLKEAELQGDGKRLGEMGSRIVSEVFVGLLQGGRYSFMKRQPDWKPTLPSSTVGDFTMADLLHFVGEPNPIG